MTSGYILVVAILVLGGVIATVGDRIGTRVGKARLSLFNLRPRRTAVLVTIVTGGVISASTLGILFALSEQLRMGVFELGNIQQSLSSARTELNQARVEKKQVEAQLTQAREEQATAERRLERINQSLKVALDKQARTEAQVQTLRGEVQDLQDERLTLIQQRNQLQTERQELVRQRDQLQAERQNLIQQRDQLQAEREDLIQQRDQVRVQIAQRDREIAERNQAIVQRDQEIAERDRVIAQRATRLKDLETQQANLERAVQTLDQYYQYYQARYQALRQGNVSLVRGQVLASGVVRIVTPSAARQAVDQLLRESNRTAIQFTQPGTTNLSEQVVQITKLEAEQLINQIQDGRDYVIRVLSAGNYVLGERNVQVVFNAAPNKAIFLAGDTVASSSLDPTNMSTEQIRQRLELLLAASEFRARGAGMLAEGVQVGDGLGAPAIIRFIEQLRQYNQPIDIEAVAIETIYTAGPLKVELVALQGGQVIFRTI